MLSLFPSKRILDPKSVMGLNCWYDATVGLYDATTGGNLITANGAQIARWEDRSGNGYHLTQATLAQRPTILTNALNGLRGVNFNGSSQSIEEATNQAGNLTNKQLYVFMVFRFSTYSSTSSSNIISRNGGSTSGQTGQWHIRRWDMSSFSGAPGTFMGQVHTNGVWEFGVGNWSSTAYNYSVMTFPRTQARSFNARIFVNDATQATSAALSDNGTPNAITNHRLNFGSRISTALYTKDLFCNCVICEVAIYLRNSFFTQKEYVGLSKYFRRKWNV